ncbi:hypothetical protein EG832_11100 [bacterium]|nr:hypothetical protein [bacterium]
MSNLELLLAVSNVVIPAMTYFAGVQRGKREKKEDIERLQAEKLEDFRRQRIEDVAQTYVKNVLRTTGFHGLVSAGALTLSNDEEIRTVCRIIVSHGKDDPILPSQQILLQDVDLYLFLTELNKDQSLFTSSKRMKELIEKMHGTKMKEA